MPDAKAQFIIELLKTGGGAEEATRSLLGVQAAANQVRESFRMLKDVAGVIGLGLGGGELLRSSIEQFVEAEKAVSKLNASLHASGQFTTEYRDSLLEAASALSTVTAVEDNAIIAVQAQLIAFGATRSQIQLLTPVVLDFAQGLGIDARSAAIDLGKALQGNFTMLQRYGIQVDEAASQTEKMASVVEQLKTRYEGMTALFARTATGQLALAKNALNDLKKEMGDVVVHGIQPITVGINLLAKEFGQLKKDGPEAIDLVKASLVNLLQTVGAGMVGLPGFQGVFAFIMGKLKAEKEANAEREKAVVLSAQEKEALRELVDLQEKLGIATMRGEEQKRAEIERTYSEQLAQINALAAKAGESRPAAAVATGARSAALLGRERSLADIDNETNAREAEVILQQAELGEKVIAQLKGFSDVKVGLINEEFRQRREALEAYYDLELSRASNTAEQIEEIERRKTRALEALEKQRYIATNKQAQILEDVEHRAVAEFSSGIANAFGEIVSGSKSASEAFKDFFAEFAKRIAEMIIEMEIALLLKTLLFGAGGQSVSFQQGAAAIGGMFIAAAGGVPGVEEVNGPTYFPRFNVLAGEAGREVMTVMAQPQTYNIDGLMAQIGNVGPRRLAITDATQLQSRLTRPAGGGSAGAGGQLAAADSLVGSAEITVRLEPGLIAEVTNNSIAGAKIQLTQDAARNTPFAASIKKLTA